MRRSWRVLGLVVVLGMILLPPMRMTLYDPVGELGTRRLNDTTWVSTPTTTHLVYRPLWWPRPKEVGVGRKVASMHIAWTWLLLQIAGVVVLVEGGRYLWRLVKGKE